MPILAKRSATTGDPRYAEKALIRDVFLTRNTLAGGLYNKKDGLWCATPTLCPYKEPNGKRLPYWSRGNGLVVVASRESARRDLADDPQPQRVRRKTFRTCVPRL